MHIYFYGLVTISSLPRFTLPAMHVPCSCVVVLSVGCIHIADVSAAALQLPALSFCIEFAFDNGRQSTTRYHPSLKSEDQKVDQL